MATAGSDAGRSARRFLEFLHLKEKGERVMINKRLRCLALAGVCLTAIATAPAVYAQQAGGRTDLITNGPQANPSDAAGPAAAQRNQRESGQYEMLLRSNPAFRARRIAKECGPISDPQLHASCVASFDR